MIDIKKASFIIFNFYVFSNEKPTKKPCSGKCSNKDNEETIVVNLKGNSGEQYEHNESPKDNDDNDGEDKPIEQPEDDKKFDFEEYTYIPKSTNFYLLSSTCSSLILKIKQFADVTTFQDSLKNAKTEEDLKKIQENLTKLNKKRDDLITGINGKLDNVGLSLIDLDYSNFLLNSYKINDLETLSSEIDKKIQKYFDDKITPLKEKIGNYCKKGDIKNSEEYKNYENYIKNPDNEKNLKDYLTEINKFEKEIFTVWQNLADLAELRSILETLITEIKTEISNVNDNVKKENFTKMIEAIKNSENKEEVKKCIDEVQNLKEDVKKVLDEEKKEKELEENIKKIEESTNFIQGLIDELKKEENKEKYSNKITGDFTTKFGKLKEEKEELKKKSVNDLNKKQTDLYGLKIKIEKYKNLVDDFVDERNKINQKIDNLTNTDDKSKQYDKNIIASYKSDIENKKNIQKYSDHIKNICKLFEKSDDNINKINSLKKLKEVERDDYINKIKNIDYSNLKSNTFNDDYIKNFNEEIDKIFKDAENANIKALLEDYEDKIKFTTNVNVKGKLVYKEIDVVELLKTEKSFTKKKFESINNQINNDIKNNMLQYINFRQNEKNNDSLKISSNIFKYFINCKNEVSFNPNILTIKLPSKIKNQINNIIKNKKLKGDEYTIFIYNLLRKLLLNIEIDYSNDPDRYKDLKVNKNFNNFDIDFIIPLDNQNN